MKIEGLDRLLPLVRRPGRYAGGEWGAVVKDWDSTRLKVALCFPDVYEAGMSHLGLQILYFVLNAQPDVLAERVFSPWPDMEALLRERGLPLFSLETRHALSDFDVVGISIPHESAYTAVLGLLDLGGIPLRARDRDRGHPLVLGGGGGCFNPEPLAEFFDAFFIGEAEEGIVEVVRAWGELAGEEREKALLELARSIQGLYVPRFYEVRYKNDGTVAAIEPTREGVPARVGRRWIPSLRGAPVPPHPIVPNIEIVHDRISVEVMRGCTRGCRFCQAGIVYRPVRERPPEEVVRLVDAAVRRSGYTEVSLSSLSTSDYTGALEVLAEIPRRLADVPGVSVSLPSLHADAFAGELGRRVAAMRKTGVTLAPECGTERLRRVVNKDVSDESLLAAARILYALGWRALKLYFMIGLPTETEEDLRSIMDLARRVSRAAGRPRRVTVAISPFVPKPHTPLQWAAANSLKELCEKVDFLKGETSDKSIVLKWHDPKMSALEAVLARGDRRLAAAVEQAYLSGARLDAWSELFDFGRWEAAWRRVGVDPSFYAHRQRGLHELLPWDHIDCGVSKAYLLREWKRALAGEPTPDCRRAGCLGCGLSCGVAGR